MLETAKIPGLMTTAEAAVATGLSAHRIGCLARAGEIDAVKSGNTILVDAASLQSYTIANQGRGRPMSARTAYAALWLLSGVEVEWLSYAQSRRLRICLQSATAESLFWQLRKRADTHCYRASESFLDAIAKSLFLSGASSEHLAEFGLLQSSDTVEGYCLKEVADRFKDSFFLVEDSHGNVIVHEAPWLPERMEDKMPIAVAAADLAQSSNTREREAGLTTLRRLLDEYRNT